METMYFNPFLNTCLRSRLLWKPATSFISTISSHSHKAIKKGGLKKITSILDKEIKELEAKLETHDKQRSTQAYYKPFSEVDYMQIYDALSVPLSPQPKSPKLASIRDKYKISSSGGQNFTLELETPPFETNSETGEHSKTLISIEDIKALANSKENNPSLKSYSLDLLLFNKILTNCVKKKDINATEEILKLMEKFSISPDVRTYEHLIDLYSRVGDLNKAVLAFNLIESNGLKPTIFAYHYLIRAYCNNNHLIDAFKVYEKIKTSRLIPTQPIYTTLIKGCIDRREMALAWKTFDYMRLEICEPDEVTYSLMIHACAKSQEVERAFDLFQEMTEKGLSPTDVTFNSLLNACALRKDILRIPVIQHGFQADQITYNTLIFACSKQGDLATARKLLKRMMESTEKQPELAPNVVSYVNMFWVYSSYKPAGHSRRLDDSAQHFESSTRSITGFKSDINPIYREDSLNAHAKTDPFLPYHPETDNQAFIEAKMIFDYIVHNANRSLNRETVMQNQNIVTITPFLIDAYLNVVVRKGDFQTAVSVYTDVFSNFKLEHTGWTFIAMLRACFRHRRLDDASRIWKDWIIWWKEQSTMYQNIDTHKREIKFKAIGHTIDVRYQAYRSMINTLARCDEVPGAIKLLIRLGQSGTPKFSDFYPLYHKCIQKEDKEAMNRLLIVCAEPKTKLDEVNRLLLRKWNGGTKFR
ncbi:hypothetical protein G9A89_016036 [Geosiphon pyriformis]|nr:hypothetical protein G9A89_016036 [Geosiphon pyriformis]